MLNEQFVINATVHPYNLGPDNVTETTSAWRRTKGLSMHHKMLSNDDASRLADHELFSDFDYDAFVEALFLESAVDYAFVHTLPNLGFNREALVIPERAAALRDAYPNRFLMYGNVTPLEVEHSLTKLEYQITELGIRGLKLYPAATHGLSLVGWRMDDPKIAFPIFEKCLEHGITNVAIHKAATLGYADLDIFKVSDLEGAAKAFPEINFQMVHAGWAYLEETKLLMERYSNILANLELTFSMIVRQPRQFAEILGQLLWWHLEDQIVFSDGCNVVHPQPGLAAFADFQMPEDLVEEKGYPQLTDEIKAKILHGNIARVHNLDIEELKVGIKGDVFEEAKAEGFPEPWTGLRRRTAGKPAVAGA
jgi:predicted TIM-barrel fold metal-dependent hydrolase